MQICINTVHVQASTVKVLSSRFSQNPASMLSDWEITLPKRYVLAIKKNFFFYTLRQNDFKVKVTFTILLPHVLLSGSTSEIWQSRDWMVGTSSPDNVCKIMHQTTLILHEYIFINLKTSLCFVSLNNKLRGGCSLSMACLQSDM